MLVFGEMKAEFFLEGKGPWGVRYPPGATCASLVDLWSVTKPVWFLDRARAGHGLSAGANRNIRLSQCQPLHKPNPVPQINNVAYYAATTEVWKAWCPQVLPKMP